MPAKPPAKKPAPKRPPKTVGAVPRRRPRDKKPASRAGKLKRPGRLLAHGCAFTTEICESIIALLETGDTRKIAAGKVGIGERTLQGWAERGRDSFAKCDETADADKPEQLDKYGRFLQRVIQAEAFARGDMLDAIRAARHEDWKAAAWILERVDSREFGRSTKVEGIVRDENGDEQSAGELLLDKLADIAARGQRDSTPEE